MNAPVLISQATYEARAAFVAELAKRLHRYGTTAHRIEGAVAGVASRLGLECEVWSNPTGIILSFADPVRGQQFGFTRVIRLEPGEQNLGQLAATDAIAGEVIDGRLAPIDGHAALMALDRAPGSHAVPLTVLSFGLSAAAVAGLIGGGTPTIAVSGGIGMVIGCLSILSAGRVQLAEALDAIAAIVATLLAAAVATYLVPVSVKTVILASLIVLMPGLALTNAVAELASQQLVSGTARFAGALMTLLKLTFGTVAGMQIVQVLGWVPVEAPLQASPPLVEFTALLVAAYAFAVLFKAARRDYPLVMLAVALGYVLTRLGGEGLGLNTGGFPGGAFVASIGVAAFGNAYGRWANRPATLIRVPGIILLVPGSVGFRSLSLVMERDVFLGLDTAFSLVTALIAIVAGLLFGNLLVPTRRNL
jgi:uncharacterized membrane protein YjjP (DUF1212 family)